MSAQRIQGDTRVDGLAFVHDGTPRLEMPHGQIDNLRGEAGGLVYGFPEVTVDGLRGTLKGVDWSMQAASAGRGWLRDRDGRFEMTVERIELPHGLHVTRAARGVELIAPHASLADVKLSIPDLDAFRRPAPTEPAPPPATPVTPATPATPPEPPPLRQGRLHFLDAINGSIAFRIAVVLDLPVVGKRTLDQSIKVTIEDGTFDYRQLERGLNWLEGAFLDIGLDDGRFRVGWGVPLIGQTKDILWWPLDLEALALAALGRIPLRALVDFRMPGGGGGGGGNGGKKDGGSKRLRSMTLGDLDLHLSMVAPRNVDLRGGTVRFGGDDEPGIVDLRVTGALVHPPAPGGIKAEAGALDMTLKDVHLGRLGVTADRLTIGPIDTLVVAFDGFRPRSLAAVVHRVTATNLALTIG